MKEYQDYYFQKAKKENYPARSVYKLQEIEAKFHLIPSGSFVLDLGAAPGSWTLWTAKHVGEQGRVVSCDLHSIDIALPDNVHFFKEDVFDRSETFEKTLKALGPFDTVISDMAPRTTGQKCTDQARSYNLAEEAFALACQYLKEKGNFIVKIFMGPDVQKFLSTLRGYFTTVKTFKPKSSRSESKETFIIGIGFCGKKSS